MKNVDRLKVRTAKAHTSVVKFVVRDPAAPLHCQYCQGDCGGACG